MTVLLDGRPAALPALFRPGKTFTFTLIWPAGYLAGRTWTAALDDEAPDVAVDGDTMTITVSAEQATAVGEGGHEFALTDTTSGGAEPVLVGSWTGSMRATTSASTSVEVATTAGTVEVAVVGPDPLTGRRAQLESIGAAINQTDAQTERDRWLALIRDAGSAEPSASTLHYIGGDVCDGIQRADGSVFWVLADYTANPGANDVVDDDDNYTIVPLAGLQRNGAIFEATPGGTFGGQVYRAGTAGIWLDADAGGGFDDHLWWPLTLVEDSSTLHVGAWLNDYLSGTAHGTNVDSHIITLNFFGGYGSTTPLNLGDNAPLFNIECMRKDSTHVYILGGEFVPDFAPGPAGDGLPTYALGTAAELREHYLLHRLARVPIGELTTIANWRYWDGASWVEGVENAAVLVDTSGNSVKGAGGISKTPAGHWLMVANPVGDTHLSVYTAAAPQGPWQPIARVPIPTAGATISGGTAAAWHGKIIDHLDAPAEHSIAMVTMTLLGPTGNGSGLNVRRWTPQFLTIPWY